MNYLSEQMVYNLKLFLKDRTADILDVLGLGGHYTWFLSSYAPHSKLCKAILWL